MRASALWMALLPLLLVGCATVSVARTAREHPPRIVFATAIEEDQPVDEIEALSADQDRLCLSGRWFDLPHRTHAYRYELRDAAGQVIYVGEQEVTPTAATWFTYSCYSRTRAEKAGTWTYLLTMGDFEQRGEIEVAVRDRKTVGVLGILKASDDQEVSGIFGPGEQGDLEDALKKEETTE